MSTIMAMIFIFVAFVLGVCCTSSIVWQNNRRKERKLSNRILDMWKHDRDQINMLMDDTEVDWRVIERLKGKVIAFNEVLDDMKKLANEEDEED